MSHLRYQIPLQDLWRNKNHHDEDDVEQAPDASVEELELLRKAEEFKLPAVVQTDISSWIKVANTLAITTALFAAVQISLAQIVEQCPKADSTNTLWRTIRWFSYSTVLINIGGTAASISVVNMASSLSHHARDLLIRDETSHPRMMLNDPPTPLSKHLLRPHNSRLRLKKFGSASIFVTFSLWVWATQTQIAAGLLMPVLLPACWLTFSVIHY